MITKAKSLYQVKLILDYLPEKEYELIPQETIDYIEDNMEYDENIKIDPDVPLENQDIDDKTYEFLEKILKEIENIQLKSNTSKEVAEYITKVKKENENFNDKIEIIKLNQIIKNIQKENSKIPKAKELIEEYKKVLQLRDNQIYNLKKRNQNLYESINKLPKIIKKIFFKDFHENLINKI